MKSLSGPWTTGMHAGGAATLSTFWKRRMTMLPRLTRSEAALPRRTAVVLLLCGIAAGALPTFHVHPALAEPPGAAAQGSELPGRIFVWVQVMKDEKVGIEQLVIAIDPNNGKWDRICDGKDGIGVRVSPDGETLGFGTLEQGAWTCATQKDSSLARVFDRGFVRGWSPDSKHIVVTEEKLEGEGPKRRWGKLESWRMNANGTDVIKLPIPESDGVNDWSPDGKWFVISSGRTPGRHPLYVMRPDASDERLITEGAGWNGSARFSPDSRKLVYTHVEKGGSSLWIVNVDGTNPTKVLKEDDLSTILAACWSPDGKHLAVARYDLERVEGGRRTRPWGAAANYRIEVIDTDGKNPKALKLVDLDSVYGVGFPDWR